MDVNKTYVSGMIPASFITNNMRYTFCISVFIITAFLLSCNTSRPGLFTKKTPHEHYGTRITDAGLRETALGRLWFQAAEQSLARQPLVEVPYMETGYFAAERPRATAVKFTAQRGEKIRIVMEKKPATNFSVYMDLWQRVESANTGRKHLAAADTATGILEYDVRNQDTFVLRLQPELLQSGEYTFSISKAPSLAFPISTRVNSNIGSFWGAGRDRGARKHEGIDIFAPFRSPAVAAADGVITGSTENALGGKVVFLRPSNKDFTLYYAHLDTQLVHQGQVVKEGDTVGLVGNTGNARTTSPHLHFGIYTSGGAIDPLPFVNRVIKTPGKTTASLTNLGKTARMDAKGGKLYQTPGRKSGTPALLGGNTILLVESATGDCYNVTLPDGQKGFVISSSVTSVDKFLQRLQLKNTTSILDSPDVMAPRKAHHPAGENLSVLGNFNGFYLIRDKNDLEGWVAKSLL